MKPRVAPNLDQLGATLGPRLAQLITDAIVDTKARSLHTDAAVISKGIEGILDLIGAELHPFLAPTLRAAAAHPDLPPHTADLLSFIADHRGEAASVARAVIGVTGAGTGIGTLVNAEIAPAVQQLLRVITTALLDPQSLAQLVVRDIRSIGDARVDAAKQNIPGPVFDWMVDLSRTPPDTGTLFDLANRGLIGEADLQRVLRQGGLELGFEPLVAQLRRQLLSPADAADMVVRGIIDQAEGEQIAAQSGMEAADFDRLVRDTGEPLALEQLLLLYRRGQLDDAQLDHGIKQSHVKDEWIPYAKELRFTPPSPADAIRAAVQNQLPMGEAISKAAQAGQDPAEFGWLFNTAGRPPGTVELIQLWRKGKIGPDVVAQAIRESDIKTKYVPTILELFEQLPPPRTVAALLRAGAITDAEAAKLLAQEGVPATLAAAEIKAAHNHRTSAARHLSTTTILKLLHDHAITDAQAVEHLVELGMATTDAQLTVEAEQLHAAAAAQDRAIGHVHSLYVGHRLDRAQCVSALTALKVPIESQSHLLASWDTERVVNEPRLTHAQITQALKHGVIDQPTATRMIEQLGYSPFDTWLLISIALGGPAGAPPTPGATP